MNLIPVKVECHSGYKANEYPICFYWDNVLFSIKEIVDRWYQAEPTPDWPVANYFRICTEGGSKYILKHELKSDEWFIVSPEARYKRN